MAQKYIQDPLRPGVSIPNPAYFSPAKPVVADNLVNPAAPVKLPSAPAMPDYNTLMAQGQALLSQINDLQGQQSALKQYGLQDTNQLQKDPETGSYVPIQAPQAPAQSQESEMTSLLKSYLGEMPEPVNPADSYQKALEASGMQGANQQVLANQQSLTKAQSELGMINANLQALVGQTQQRQLEIAGEPISAGAMQGRNIDEARNLAIRAIPYQVQVLAKQAEIAGLQGNLEYSQGLLEQAKTQLNTMFDLENDYQQRLYEYNQRKIDAVYEFASKEQQAKLDAKKVEEQRKWEEKQSEIEYERDVEMRKLDAMLEASDPSAILDRAIKQAQLAKIQKETSLLEEPDPKEIKKTEEAIKDAKASIVAARDKVSEIDSLKEDSGMDSRVGATFFSRIPTGDGFWGTIGKGVKTLIKGATSLGIGTGRDIKDALTEEGSDFAAKVHRLVAGLSLDSLIEAKSRGATFGALSEGELSMLANAASSINDWEIKDKNGKGIGVWDINQASFKAELDRIKELTNRAILFSEGTILDTEEQSILNEVYNTADPSSWY